MKLSSILFVIGVYAIIPRTIAESKKNQLYMGVDNLLSANIVKNKMKNNNLKQLRIECDFVTCTQ